MKIISLILVTMTLVCCNEASNEITIRAEEAHDDLYKKLKFHRCKMDIFNLMTNNDELIDLMDDTTSFKVNYFDVWEEVQNTQDTLALFYACDRMVK